MRKNVLDKGFISIVDHLGSDLTVVNSARVSFGKRKDTFDAVDKKLVKYLADHKHHSPFRHIIIQFHIKAPEFVMRQWYKHVVGIETTSSHPVKDHAWNEISQRYVPVHDYYIPSEWREQSDDNKQASDGLIKKQDEASNDYKYIMEQITEIYEDLLDYGVAKEQARIVLPLSIYTEVIWTASFQAVANFLELRNHDHAQWEIRQYAMAMESMVKDIFPEHLKHGSE
jgi:thymidylate synthase (FAD)